MTANRWLWGTVPPPAFRPIDGEPLWPGRKLSVCSSPGTLGLAASGAASRAVVGRPAVGVQLLARRGEQRTLVALADRLEAALGGWTWIATR